MRYGMVIHPLLRLFTMARYINPLYNESLMDWWSPRHGYVIHLFTIAHMHWQPLGIKIDTPLAWLMAGGTGSSASTIFEGQFLMWYDVVQKSPQSLLQIMKPSQLKARRSADVSRTRLTVICCSHLYKLHGCYQNICQGQGCSKHPRYVWGVNWINIEVKWKSNDWFTPRVAIF